ncbi:uncharacterized protein LOC121721252 isoform X1 [Alosa sapidissima]|uniref:uncharacterized protein LOC121721252 isoform X1 n=1 Tax=Alosa sapidissima TaxID=34773 RepID=UPI001C0A6032|nr:uncharacterized protein LOC121721252 isoform X1 [Alosa sapidissima]
MRIIILVLTCLGSCCVSPNKTLQHVLLGSTTVINCGSLNTAGTDEVKWFFSKDQGSKRLLMFHINKQGRSVITSLIKDHPKRTVARNMSLVIEDFNEEDEGVYVCEVYLSTSPYTITTSKLILEKKTPPSKWWYAVRGDGYQHECTGMGKAVQWTFQPLTGNRDRQYSQNSSLVLTNIEEHISGNYTCWIISGDGQQERAFSLILCIVSGTSDERESPQNCSLLCSKRSDIETLDPLVVVTDRVNITVYHKSKKPDGRVDCIVTLKGGHKKDNIQSNSSAFHNGFGNFTKDITNAPGINTNGIYSENVAPVSHGSSRAVKSIWISLTVCLGLCCLVIVLVACHRRRVEVSNIDCLRDCHGVCHFNSRSEDEVHEVHYMSVPFRRSDGSVLRSANECVYSDIKVQNAK